ncbi:MAG TPA: sugar ABC transporter permease [Thermomicrobiales bacterium]|nr:sugar ABC transporter permease [Thermomicrobiales bacterium]
MTALPTEKRPSAPSLARRFQRLDESHFGLLLIAPTAALLLVFLVYPIAYAIAMSFNRLELTVSPDQKWVGLANYGRILGDQTVRDSIARTLAFAAMTVAISVVLSLTLALVLNETFRGRKVVRVLILLPWAVAPVVNGVMWRYLFQSNYGLVNAVLARLGLIDHYQVWLENASLALLIAAVATAWKGMPFETLILLATLQSIPESLFRAAKMDGAGVLARFRYVILPHLRNTLIFVVLLETIVSLQVFDLIFTLTRGGPGQGTVVLSYLVYINAFERLSLGPASAMAILLTLLIMALSALGFGLMATRRRRSRLVG